MPALILAPYAGFLALLYVWLSFRVTGFRRRHRQALGDNGNDAFQRTVRAQANFGEYVPFCLLLLYLLAELGSAPLLIHGLAIALVLGRLLHAYSLLAHEPKRGGWPYYRTAAMVCTFGVLATSGLVLLARWFQFHFAF